jgi:hypothetical protein
VQLHSFLFFQIYHQFSHIFLLHCSCAEAAAIGNYYAKINKRHYDPGSGANGPEPFALPSIPAVDTASLRGADKAVKEDGTHFEDV